MRFLCQCKNTSVSPHLTTILTSLRPIRSQPFESRETAKIKKSRITESNLSHQHPAYQLTKSFAVMARPAFLAPRSIIPYDPIVHAYLNAHCDYEPHKRILIEEIKLDDTRQLQLMSEFCIDMFFNRDQDIKGENLISRGWRDIKLAAMRQAQMMDFSMPTGGNRAIFVAKNLSNDIVGCCEVIEEKFDLKYLGDSNTTMKRNRNKSGRMRPIIENLSVDTDYRRKGIGLDLVNACESAVQGWVPKHDAIFAQVEEDNISALNLFHQRGYRALFTDLSSTKVALDGTLFVRKTTVSKVTVRKFLDSDADFQLF